MSVKASLDSSVRFLRGVGPRRAEALERLGIRTLEDLLLHLPRRYFDRSSITRIRDLVPGTTVCVRARVEAIQGRSAWRGRRTVVATVSDDSARLRVVWFNAWANDALRPGNEVVLAGPIGERDGRLEMRQPEFERVDADSQPLLHAGRIVPLYPATQGVTQKWLRVIMDAALSAAGGDIPDPLPERVRGDLPSRAAALRAAHYPETLADAERARARLVLEELFVFELGMLRQRAEARQRHDGIRLDPDRGLQRRYLDALAFALTGAQRRVLDEIERDMASGEWMQRLVLGDVGAGKTVIAVAAALLAIGNGWQAALMAPTEPLALQHAERLAPVCAALNVRLDVLVGSRSAADKDAVRNRLAEGDIDLVVGTHALARDDLQFARLALAVVDEQQRFGVLQRAALYRGAQRPHVLVLTATPIPRSLALALCGDLDLSLLDEKPPGRQPVTTRLVPAARREAMWQFVRAEVEAGRQAYVVLPLIDDSDALELRAARGEFATLSAGALAGLPLALLHGRLPAAERDAALAGFHHGEVRVLVCTSVVEVGLDVAAASVVIIHHPERFGLAQLHQLRGRVGRGDAASYCFLLPGANVGAEGLERLRRFAATEDGFRIAELDLELRGPGEVAGTRQHGHHEWRVAEMSRDLAVLERARVLAADTLASDPHLERAEHRNLRAEIEARERRAEVLAAIG